MEEVLRAFARRARLRVQRAFDGCTTMPSDELYLLTCHRRVVLRGPVPVGPAAGALAPAGAVPRRAGADRR